MTSRKTKKKPGRKPANRKKPDKMYALRLFVTGQTPRSSASLENLRRICDERLVGKFELEVIDIYQQPELAKDAQIIAAPTLIKLLPLPLRRLVGDLSNKRKVLMGLDLKAE
jgi:circadian clock protein KaiB